MHDPNGEGVEDQKRRAAEFDFKAIRRRHVDPFDVRKAGIPGLLDIVPGGVQSLLDDISGQRRAVMKRDAAAKDDRDGLRPVGVVSLPPVFR